MIKSKRDRGSFHRVRINHRIRVREVFVIGADGEKLGVMSSEAALAKAKEAGLDLVEVSPGARPPVAKILDYGKYRYEIAKRDKEAKKHNMAARVKELKFHINIEEGDYLTKMKRAEQFMLKGMKVKIMMVFRGREMQKQGLGFDLVRRIQQDLGHVGTADLAPKMLGRNINMMLTPLPEKKRHRKYTEEHDIDDLVDDDAENA